MTSFVVKSNLIFLNRLLILELMEYNLHKILLLKQHISVKRIKILFYEQFFYSKHFHFYQFYEKF